MKNEKLKGNLILLLAAFIWGTSFIAQSKGVETVAPILFNGVRSILGAVVLLPVIFIMDASKKKSGTPVMGFDKTVVKGGIICGVFLCFASSVQTVGMLYTSPGKAGFLTAMYMIIVPLIGIFTGNRPGPIAALAVLIAVVGMYLMCIDSEFSINKGDIILLICAFLFSGHILAVNHFSPITDGVKLSCIQFFVCGILGTIGSFIFEKPDIAPLTGCIIPIAYAGIMSCGIAYTCQIIGQKYTDPTSASLLMSLESVFSTLATVVLVACGWQITGGNLSMREIIGCILMFAAILLVQLPPQKKKSDLKA